MLELWWLGDFWMAGIVGMLTLMSSIPMSSIWRSTTRVHSRKSVVCWCGRSTVAESGNVLENGIIIPWISKLDYNMPSQFY